MEIAVISGKGGTGKSSISAAFASLNNQVVLADCDVDAANLHLLFNPKHDYVQHFTGARKAVIDQKRCINCGLCMEYCRFDAIHKKEGQIMISKMACDGCQLCTRVCPQQAINMVSFSDSKLYAGSFRHGQMVYGHLAPGEENSGKLVSLVRDKARQLAFAHHINTTIIDGPPGIGCPVISSITGVDYVVIVTEPSLSALSDLKRTLSTTNKFKIKTQVIINKYNLSSKLTDQIQAFCNLTNTPIAGLIPFDRHFVDAMVQCKSIIEWSPDSLSSIEIVKSWKNIIQGHEKENTHH